MLSTIYQPILFANLDPAFPNDRIERALAAYTKKLAADFAPNVGVPMVELHFVGNRALAPGEWGITYDPRTDSEYLGEHHLEDVPRGVVLTGACKQYGEDPDETASHELDELLGDPLANLSIEIDGDGTEEAYEMDDAVQGTGYQIDGVAVANFVYPRAYFCGKGSKYDHRGALSAPHTRTPGGYRLIRKPGQPWSQDAGERIPEHKLLHRAHRWSRRGRRHARRLRALGA